MRILAVQASPVVGDIAGNAAAILEGWRRGREVGARIVVFPELAVCGYPPRDLLFRDDFVDACMSAARAVAEATRNGPILVFGCPWRDGGLRNGAVVVHDGGIVAVRYKSLLPCYDVFDEPRWFMPEAAPAPVDVDGLRLGVVICEDAWNAPGLVEDHHYALDPVARMTGCAVVLNLSASPFQAGKGALRAALVARQARQLSTPLVYCNQVGAHDELVFDGASFAVGPDGACTASAPSFVMADLLVDLVRTRRAPFPVHAWEDEILDALVLGIRDYARRSGFRSALLGLSGGVDSALVAFLAVRALGADNVMGVGLPGPYNAPESLHDAEALARALGCGWSVLPIGPGFDALRATLAPALPASPPGVVAENLQSRIRGTLLMGLSNASGQLLLTTGNKSEIAVGYCTLYGDMNGGLAPIGDLWKTEVYRLAHALRARDGAIPLRTLERAPSAELAPGQTDQDSLPPYDLLDPILHLHVEEQLGAEAIVARGFADDVVRRVVDLVRRAEHKRRQGAPILKVSPRAFGTGRDMPLAQAWRG
ncbi:MAG: Glutamine-dependent synthetase [Pseudomonadota bacterium]